MNKSHVGMVSLVMVLLTFLLGCGPSESEVQADFHRLARRSGIPIVGEAQVAKMRRVRVDGQRKEVWSVNYDVPNVGGTKTWKRAFVTYENGQLTVIRTDVEGWVK